VTNTLSVIVTLLLFIQGIGGNGGIGGKGGFGGGVISTPVPAILQSALSTTDGVFSATLPNHAAGGISCVLGEFTTASLSISNTAGYSWGTPASNLTASTGDSLYIWCATKSADASSDTVTVTSSAYHGGLVFVDISNVTSIDASQGASGSGYSSITTGTFTVSGANDMVLSVSRTVGGGAVGSGFTSLTSTGTSFWGNDDYSLAQYKQITGSPASATAGLGDPWDILAVALK
jgi:hypothetical protein